MQPSNFSLTAYHSNINTNGSNNKTQALNSSKEIDITNNQIAELSDTIKTNSDGFIANSTNNSDYSKKFVELTSYELSEFLEQHPTKVYSYNSENVNVGSLCNCYLVTGEKKIDENLRTNKHQSIIIQPGLTTKGQYIDVLSAVSVNLNYDDDCQSLGINIKDPATITAYYKNLVSDIIKAAICNGNKNFVITGIGLGSSLGILEPKHVLNGITDAIVENKEIIKRSNLNLYFADFKSQHQKNQVFSKCNDILQFITQDITKYLNDKVSDEGKWCVLNPSNLLQNGANHFKKNDGKFHGLENDLFKNMVIPFYDLIYQVAPQSIQNKKIDVNNPAPSITTTTTVQGAISFVPKAKMDDVFKSKFFPDIHPDGYRLEVYDKSTHNAHAKEVLGKLENGLKEEGGCKAKTYYKRLLKLESKGTGNTSSYVLGDADAELTRLYLLAVQGGHAILNDKAQEALVKLINLAAKFVTKFDEYCKSEEVNKLQHTLVSNTTYILNCPNKLYSIGDILHDRWANDKTLIVKAIDVFRHVGGIFISGNHDVFKEALFFPEQAGSSAIKQGYGFKDTKLFYGNLNQMLISEINTWITNNPNICKQWKVVENNLFVRSHFDEDTNIFYNHYGFYFENDGNTFVCSHGKIDLSVINNLSELVTKINDLPRPVQKLDGVDVKVTTTFRPSRHNVKTDEILANHRLFKGVMVVHGHDGKFNTKLNNIINTNARDEAFINDGEEDSMDIKVAYYATGVCINR